VARSEAFFLMIDGAPRFSLLHLPEQGARVTGAFVFVHPFAEEMNRCRRMAALQSRTLASAGWAVLQIDLYGCGDSAGDFGEATWSRWTDDVVAAMAWLNAECGHAPDLWAIRGGCLLAAHAAERRSPAPNLVLWQPPVSGTQVLQQFLRLEVANRMLGSAQSERSGTRQLKDRLAQGESLEIAGYVLSPQLASGLDAAELKLPVSPARTAWFEIAATPETELSPGVRLRLDAWQRSGHRVEAHRMQGAAFWQTLENTDCPALIEATVEVIGRWRD
jgi:uncharacterized protein